MASPESGKHLLEVEELLETHRLLEGDMALQMEKVRAVSAAALRFADAEGRCAAPRGQGCSRGWVLQGISKGLGALQGLGSPRVPKDRSL